MPIPDYQTIMLPLLKIAVDQKEHRLRDALEVLAKHFNLNDAERKQLLPSGKQEIFDNRVGWARTYLKKAGLLDIPKAGYFCITQRGIELLNQKPPRIDVGMLNKYQEFRDFKIIRNLDKPLSKPQPVEDDINPIEQIENALQIISNELSRDLLEKLKDVSPKQFEDIVVDLVLAMGYGGNRKDAAEAIGGTGDEGVDGVISEDRLGLSRVYIQAKRWKNTLVGHPVIRDFIGALDIKHFDKGILITTSTFNKDAHEAVGRSQKKIRLIDGNELAKLMIEYNIGVSANQNYIIKRLDTDYFA